MNDLWCWAIYTDLRPEPQFPHLQYKANNTYALELYLRFRDQISYIAYGWVPARNRRHRRVRFEKSLV